jgi:molybdenum cofactor sulfurtransferase
MERGASKEIKMMSTRQDDLNIKDMDTALAGFLDAYPAYKTTRQLDDLRANEYGRLDDHHHIYLDYTGGGLYADSQLRQHLALLAENVYGNPHSTNPTSLAMTHLVEQAREYVFEFFNASPDEYVAIFTPNASGALKLVGESYPFGVGDQYLLTFDNHNSVNGIREFARARGAETTYVPVVLPDMRVDELQLDHYLGRGRPAGQNLFAYPAQSNFSGVQHPLEWIGQAQAMGWDVLLDAAAFVPTNRLDLSRWKPDYVPISFYKMFGYPTGVGCLLARRDSLAKLQRPWFAGGTITVASVQGDKYYMAEGEAAFEDGTLNYLTIPAVEIGLRHIAAIGIDTIHQRVRCLTGWLLDNLSHLHHANGEPLVRVYGPLDTHLRGGTLTVNFYDPKGRFFDHRLIEAEANKVNISLRTGCFCNPGGGEIALGISQTELVACFQQPGARLTLDDFRVCIDGKSSGAVRISVGLVSNFADVYRLLQFAQGFLDVSAEED